MRGVGKFIDVTLEIGDMISKAVEKAAKDLKIDSVLWYHDDPIWFLEETRNGQDGSRNGSVVRRIQITPYWTPGEGEKLYFVPQIFFTPQNGKIIKTLKRVNPDDIKNLPLKTLREDPEKFSTQFSKKAKEVWAITQKYNPSQLDGEIRQMGFSEEESEEETESHQRPT